MVRATSMTHSALARRLVRATALGAWLLPAAAIAQELPPPTLTVPPSVLQQAPAAAVPLPVLSDKQAAALAALLARDSVAQGLTDTPMVVPQDQDGLVRAALDHALHLTFWAILAIAVATLAAALLVPRVPLAGRE